MSTTEAAETVLSKLNTLLPDLESSIDALPPNPPTSTVTVLSEQVTQALVQLDSITISKQTALLALRQGNRPLSLQLSVLLARRKTLATRFSQLGDQLDALTPQ